ncbi:MAG: hypothetical protein GY856_15835 [bacterium]|nr:hypothetical protein [bacterium]
MLETEAQRELLEIALDFRRLDHRLYTLAEQLPKPENQDDMFEGNIPSDVATEIYGAIDFIRSAQLGIVIEGLEAAAKITAADLDRRFAQAQAKDAALGLPGKAPAPDGGDAGQSAPR